jgi:hypothetical protein
MASPSNQIYPARNFSLFPNLAVKLRLKYGEKAIKKIALRIVEVAFFLLLLNVLRPRQPFYTRPYFSEILVRMTEKIEYGMTYSSYMIVIEKSKRFVRS